MLLWEHYAKNRQNKKHRIISNWFSCVLLHFLTVWALLVKQNKPVCVYVCIFIIYGNDLWQAVSKFKEKRFLGDGWS